MALNIPRLCMLSGIALLLSATAACGRVERSTLRSHGARPVPASPSAAESPDDAASESPDPPTPTPPPVLPVPTVAPVPDASASACAGRPGGNQVIAALRRDRNLLPADVTPRVTTGPLCAGAWQYTVLDVPDHDPLQVVTRGTGDSLTVVTAGTYVCTPEVTGTAPPGIVSAAHCR